MRKASFGRVLWGLGLLAAAAFLVLDQLHLMPLELGFWAIFWTVVFGATLITSLVNKSLGGSIFSIAFLLIIYAKPLHIEQIVPWTVLLAAFLIWGGLRLIFKKSWKPTVIINGEKVDANWSDLKVPHKFKAEHVFSDTTSSDSGDNIVISEKMSSTARYVHSQHLETVTVNVSMGDVDVYLDSAKPAGDEVIANINMSMGDLNFYIPTSWRVDNRLERKFVDFTIDGDQPTNGPTLVLQGRANMGDITVKRV